MRSFITPLVALLLGALGSFRAAAQAPNSAWVYPSATGNLLYQLDERAQRIADFSQCGYRGGTEPLPNVSVLIPQDRWVYVSPGVGDDKALIQAAIESVKAFTPDANGWRGVVYLNAGEYQLATTLTMNSAAGVVLKGAGDDPTTGTRLRATGVVQYDLISANGSGSRSTVADTTHNLTQKLVPAGTRTFAVDDTSGLAVGHTVIVKRPSTTNWIAAIDMDQLTEPWTEGSKDLFFDRTITRIEGNWITVDAPLPQTFESQYGGGQIWRYTWSGRMQQVGIEDIYAFSDYDSPTDENHAWNFIYMSRTEHGWVRNITAQYFALSAVWLGTDGKWITVADSQCLDPISVVTGGRRYPFQTTDGELTLFVNNYARNGRHDFSFGATVAGPNAFVHGTADTALSDTGPHQRWAVGGLFDLITINGDEINIRNRGNSGTGHGWAGAYMAVWNCKASGFRVRNPPTARNWLVGSIGTIGTGSGFSVGADPEGTYDSSGPAGTGKAVYPRSLYYGQLQQRMKWPGSEFREVWLGDVDQHFSTGGTGNTVTCNATWLAQVEGLGPLPADAKFDYLVGNRYAACTLDFSLDPGDTIVAASLTVSLRGIGSADADNIWLDSTASPQTYTSLGWTPISTTVPTVRTMEVSPALLTDGRINLAFGTNSAVDFAVLHLQVRKAQRSTYTITLAPVADAYVQGGTNANTNYGAATSLLTKEDSNVDLDRETFLRWDLSGVSGKIVQARVRLAGISSAQTGNESCATFVSDDTWGETTITFANKPAAGKLFAQWLPVTGQPVEFTVTPQILDTLLGDGKLSLRILSTDNHGAAGNVSYASRENSNAANRPQLILTIENPPTSAIKAATVSALNLDTAWTNGFVPVNPDTATWNATSLAGTMTFDTDLNWSGLIVTNPAGPLTFNGTQLLSLGSAGIDMSASTVNLTLNHPVHLGDNQTWNVGTGRTIAANGTVSGPAALTKNGAGNVTLSAGSTYTGTTTIDQGTLAFTTANSFMGGLVFGTAATNTTPGILDLTTGNATFASAMLVNTNSTAANEIKIGATQTLTINNNVQIGVTAPAVTSISNLTMTGGGTFNVATAAAGTFVVGGASGTTSSQEATLDLAALKATMINTSTTGTMRVGPSTNNFNGSGTLLLPTPVVADALATTTLTAATIAVGNGSSGGGTVNNITLGTGLTRLNADTINVGTGGRDVGQIIYGQAAGDLIIRAADGTSRATGINVASLNGATANTQTSTVDLSGHDADILVASLNVGNQPRTAALTIAFNFGQSDNSLTSKLDVTNVNIGLRPQTTTTTTVTHTARVNLSGGTVTFGNAADNGSGVDIGNNAFFGNGSSSGSTVGELNISGGSVTIHNSASLAAAVRLGTNTTSGNATVTASMNLSGGTTTLGGDIIRNATSPRTTSTVRISGGTLNMGNNDIGTATEPITLTAESGTLSNVASINGTGGLTKTTAGTLVLSGNNTYTGDTTISGGTLTLGANNALPATAIAIAGATLNAATFTDTVGALDVTGSAVINLGSGASLAFANSSAIDWTGGTVAITGTFVSGSALRFGTNSSGLTAPQLARISTPGGGAVALNANGFLINASYSNWASTNAPGDTPAGDYDDDGVRNAVEYVLGGNAVTDDVSKLPAISISGGNILFTFQRDQASINATTTLRIQVGTTLLTWPDSYTVGADTATSSDGVTVLKGVPAGFDTITLTILPPLDLTEFYRLNVTITP